jgi:hypothetical protein
LLKLLTGWVADVFSAAVFCDSNLLESSTGWDVCADIGVVRLNSVGVGALVAASTDSADSLSTCLTVLADEGFLIWLIFKASASCAFLIFSFKFLANFYILFFLI